MCGIVGIINSCYKLQTTGTYATAVLGDAKEFIQDGIIASGVRGLDSTGIFQIDQKFKPYMHKLPVSGHMFIEDKTTKQFLSDTQTSPFTVCHVRAATSGRININNAHPFQVYSKDKQRSIIGVHNGSLTGWQAKAGADASKFSVDSEWALSRIAEDGADAFEDFDGSFSFVWWDFDNPNRLMFARNDQRPMVLARTKNKRHFLFGSEPGMIAWLAERNNIMLEDQMYYTDAGKMYSVDCENIDLVFKNLGQFPVPAKTTTRSGYTCTYYEGNNASYEYDEDDWHGWGHTRTSADYEEQEKRKREKMLKAIQGHLKRARDGEKEEVVIGSLLDKALDRALQDSLIDDDDDFDMDLSGEFLQAADSSWFSTATATRGEIKDAEENSWYGDIVEFTAEVWDPQTFEIYGNITEINSPIGVVYPGIMRGASKHDYDSMDTGVYSVVIGSSIDREKKANLFVVTPLNEKGQAGFEALLAA